MPRIPKPYVKGHHYCTSVGGIQHQKLCPVNEGLTRATQVLARLVTAQEDSRKSPELAKATSRPWTVQESILEFLEMKKVENRAGTWSWYTDKLKSLEERFGHRTLYSITLQDGLGYKTWLSKEKEWVRGQVRRRGLGTSTVNAYFRAAKSLFGWCCKPSRSATTGLKVNPWVEIKYGAEKGRERLITEQELQALLGQCTDGSVSGAALDFQEQLQVLRFTTMRPGELRALTWGHLQLDQHRIVFPPNLIKTKRRREVVLLDRVKAILMERKQRLLGLGALCRENDAVFSRPARNRDGIKTAGLGHVAISTNSLSQRFRRVFMRCVKLGLIEKEKGGERLVPYSSRHLRCSEMLSQGLDVITVMMDMGHADVKTTNRYTHLSASLIAQRIRDKDQQG